MKKYFIPFLILLPVAILAYLYNPVSILLLIVASLSLAVLLVVGLVRIFRKSMNAKWVRVPLTIVAICLAGVIVGMLRPLDDATIETGSVSEKLAYAYKTDQQDRMTLKTYLGSLADRDNNRLEQAKQLYNEDQITEARDKFYAAFIFHHSKSSALYEIAQQLANEAAAAAELKNDYVAQWLAKATHDRWLVSLGKPQKYGTQDKFSVSVD